MRKTTKSVRAGSCSATKGVKTDDQLHLVIDSDNLSGPRHIRFLAIALIAYLSQAHDFGPNTSLVLFVKKVPHRRTVDSEEHNRLWQLLNGPLAKLDVTRVSCDIDTDKWCLCSGGSRSSPRSRRRRTKSSLAPGVTIVFQPEWIFDILFSIMRSALEHSPTFVSSLGTIPFL